jgi:hypothetical protein
LRTAGDAFIGDANGEDLADLVRVVNLSGDP